MSDVAPATAGPDTAGLPPERLKQLYRAILLPRLIEDKALLLLRQGKLSKWFSGMGQEAIAVGVASALDAGDWILPMHRNLGVFTTRGVELGRLFRQLFGKDGGFTKGRDRTFHFGLLDKRIVGMISHLGASTRGRRPRPRRAAEGRDECRRHFHRRRRHQRGRLPRGDEPLPRCGSCRSCS